MFEETYHDIRIKEQSELTNRTGTDDEDSVGAEVYRLARQDLTIR